MRTDYDPEADTVQITLADGEAVESEEVAPGVVLDFDTAGRVLGIEVLRASETLAPGALASLSTPPG